MSNASKVPRSPTLAAGALRWVCTNNPFYVLSAGLFLIGIYVSFGAQADAAETWALMSSLAGYTVLLAATAFLLARFAKVWDDVRTVLLLIVLMFLATSVTFDYALVNNPARGIPCYLIGWVLAVALSEALLRGTGLKMPAGFRLPYHLILSLFFVYPLALRPWAKFPPSETLEWGLFGFSTIAGLAFLSLLPAIRRGPEYLKKDSSPWPWPFYPWSLFAVLALAVPARAFLLCLSMHPVNVRHLGMIIFAPYFIVPFGFALTVLLLEFGLVARKTSVIRAALLVPVAMVFLSLLGHRADPIYQTFLDTFSRRWGGDPLFVSLVLTCGFYFYAAMRRVRIAIELLTAGLIIVALVGIDALRGPWLLAPAPLVVAAALQLALGLYARNSLRILAGSSLVAMLIIGTPGGYLAPPITRALAFHYILAAIFVASMLSKDVFGQALRFIGPVVAVIAGYTVILGGVAPSTEFPQWALNAYPLVLAFLVAMFGYIARQSTAFTAGMLIPIGWLVDAVWRGYGVLRQAIAGMDYIAVSLVFFGVALVVSLSKAGWLPKLVRR